MEKRYYTNDVWCDFPRFDKWVLSVDEARRVHYDIDPSLNQTAVYLYRDASITYEGSGSHHDGAAVEVSVSGGKNSIEEICAVFEKHWNYE